MKVQPYLFFEGRCEEALDFYREALGAEVTGMMRFRDQPDRPVGAAPPGTEDKVMHASFRVGDLAIMASDGRCQGAAAFQGFSLALTVPDRAEAERLLSALAGNGGQVRMPLAETFFSPGFGMAADRFGVSWMVVTEA